MEPMTVGMCVAAGVAGYLASFCVEGQKRKFLWAEIRSMIDQRECLLVDSSEKAAQRDLLLSVSARQKETLSKFYAAACPIVEKCMADGDFSKWASGAETESVFQYHEVEDLVRLVESLNSPKAMGAHEDAQQPENYPHRCHHCSDR